MGGEGENWVKEFKGVSAVLIWSGDYENLAKWYQEKLGLEVIERLNHPEDTGVGMRLGKMYFWVGKHSRVKGKSKDPYRMMFNIRVDSVSKVYEKLKKRGVKFIAEPFKAPTFDSYFATFVDLDGNVLQLIGGK